MGGLRNPLMEKLRRKISLEDRLKTHYLFEFIDNNNYATPEDYYLAQLYADEKTKDVMNIVAEWQNHGSPK